MNRLSITGHEGELRWVYLPAVIFGPWSFTGDMVGGTLTARVVSCDEFRMQQRPLAAVVPMGRAEWRWSVIDVQISGDTLTANVARQRAGEQHDAMVRAPSNGSGSAA